MQNGIIGARLSILNKLPMTGDPHRDSLIHKGFLIFGGGTRATLSYLFHNRYVPTIHELRDTAKARHILMCLKLVDNPIECRLWEPPGGSPGILQHETLTRLWIRIIFPRSPKHPRPTSLKCRGLPDREVVCVVCVLPDLDLEARVSCDGAEIVEGSDRWIKPQFVSVHFASSTAYNANECFEIAFVLQVVVLRDHSAGAVEKTDVEDGSADGDVKGVAHKRASSKV